MFRNYFKVAIRNLLKRKVYTLINILGLATGMAVCLLIILFIQSELSYDNFQQRGDQIYRVALDRRYPGRSTSYSIIPLSIGEAIKREYPEVLESTRMFDIVGNTFFFLRIGEKVFEEKKVLVADSNFFRVFSGNFIAGDPATALMKPNSVVINESTAKRLYGSTNAIGKSFETEPNPHHRKCWKQSFHRSFKNMWQEKLKKISVNLMKSFRKPVMVITIFCSP